MTAKKIGGIALLMAMIVAVSAAVTAFTGTDKSEKKRLRVVASFYPVYIAALHLTDGVEGVETLSLTQPQTGCLHDYQLSPDNLVTLDGADALVINGAGAEAFLGQVTAQLPNLPVIDTSEGVSLMEGSHEHHHEEGEDEEEHLLLNEHIWTSPARYRQQVENLRDGLCALDPGNADRYRDNAAAYLEAIAAAETALREAAAALPARTAVIFHDSLAYFAQDLGLTVAAALPMGEEAALSAAELKLAQEAATAAGQILLLYDSQYPTAYTYVGDGAAWRGILTLDMGVTGPADKKAWLDAMSKNAAALRAAAEEGGGV